MPAIVNQGNARVSAYGVRLDLRVNIAALFRLLIGVSDHEEIGTYLIYFIEMG